ncbi:MAG TPA: VRR-NUC domain-containing protein [Dongiaceae bacterium]|nr:VRR-NUC domain-containing protein [Dongiaceae bacterium]
MATTPEARFSDEVRAALKRMRGVLGFRIESSHTAPGFPDWVIFTWEAIRLVELKVEGGTLTTAQKVLHAQLASLKIPVYLLTKAKNGVRVNHTEFNKLEAALAAILKGDKIE